MKSPFIKQVIQIKQISAICFLNILLFISTGIAQDKTPDRYPLSQRNANYAISVNLYDNIHTLKGEETVDWKNISSDSINELQFHLYWNAFKNNKTTFLGKNRLAQSMGKSFGYISITSIHINNQELIKNLEFISPDDNNSYDQTTARLRLPSSILPGSSIKIFLKFESRIPQIFARSGYNKNYFMIGQWFPKLGVYLSDPENGKISWNCHQYHSNTEFFSDFGNYDVSISLPDKYKVAATGIEESIIKDGEKNKIIKFHAEDVHDFAWCAYPDFEEKYDQWKNVKIRLLYPKSDEALTDRYFSSVKIALAYLDSVVGEYPYPNLTIIDPPDDGNGSGGMEYPSLITTESFNILNNLSYLPEIVTVHEFIHQYFYGMLASNEFEEAWLDEGFTQYMESRVMNYMFGEKSSFMNTFNFKIGDLDFARLTYLGQNPKLDYAAQKSYNFQAGGYGQFVYMKPALFLTTFQRIIGDELMNTILRKYFDTWKFRHPNSSSFIQIADSIISNSPLHNEINAKEYFNRVLYGTDVCDYSVSDITNREIDPLKGYFENDSMKTVYKHDKQVNDSVLYKCSVTIKRLGELIMPQNIKITFENGDIKYEKWSGAERYKIFEYISSSKIIETEIDPLNKIQMDINKINDSFSLKGYPIGYWKYILGFFNMIQNILQTIIIFA
jgi:hypothetical protein